MRMLKPQNVPYGRHTDYILKYISDEILVKVELSCLGKGSVSHGLGADFSFPHCLVSGDRYPKALGTISSWYKRSASRNLGVNRHGTTLRQRSRGTATGCIFSLLLAFGKRMRRCQLALKHTMWQAY